MGDRSPLRAFRSGRSRSGAPYIPEHSEFHAHHPLILGVLLDAAVHGLRKFANVKLDRFPRMADFVQWILACEPALWPAGSFLSAYCTSRDEVIEGILDGNSVAIAVRTQVAQRGAWQGTRLRQGHAVKRADLPSSIVGQTTSAGALLA